ncbi:MAG TPA: hypothetical protein DDX33_05335 [Rikenellaceae bacterium]|nr:hypothetical protein [Rikenellaceae bacterium]
MVKIGSTPTDELVRRAIIGDGTAFTELWDTNIDALRAYLSSSLKQLDDFYLDDICSRSFEKAFRQIGTYNPSISRFFTWLKVIARNTALDILESENRSRLVSIEDCDDKSMMDNIGDDTVTALETIIEDEGKEKLSSYIEGMPELYREVARRRLIEGASYKEISEELGLALNTVRTRIRRAKQMIDKMMCKEEE